jgi:hypothetical protein
MARYAIVSEAERVTPAQMNRRCHDFDSWAICDKAGFHVSDPTPHSLAKIALREGLGGSE